MTVNALRRLILVLTTLAMVVLVVGPAAAAQKKQHHHSGHALVADKLKTNGVHQIDRKGKHTVSVETKNGKIASFHVKHDTKGEVRVTKYKSKTKVALLDGTDYPAVPAQTDLGTVYIAYAYVDDDGDEEYYWFPYDEILDGDTGAIDYVPEG